MISVVAGITTTDTWPAAPTCTFMEAAEVALTRVRILDRDLDRSYLGRGGRSRGGELGGTHIRGRQRGSTEHHFGSIYKVGAAHVQREVAHGEEGGAHRLQHRYRVLETHRTGGKMALVGIADRFDGDGMGRGQGGGRTVFSGLVDAAEGCTPVSPLR